MRIEFRNSDEDIIDVWNDAEQVPRRTEIVCLIGVAFMTVTKVLWMSPSIAVCHVE